MTRQQTLMFQLAQAQLRAELNDMDFPKDVRDQTNPLLAEANHHLRAAKAAYGRVAQIHRDNEAKRLTLQGGRA